MDDRLLDAVGLILIICAIAIIAELMDEDKVQLAVGISNGSLNY